MALQFEHILPDGSYNTDTWHDGCNVLSGTKITLQKFKELPLEQRLPGDKVHGSRSRLCSGSIQACSARAKLIRPVALSSLVEDHGK